MKEWNILLKYHENMNNNENIEFVFLIYPEKIFEIDFVYIYYNRTKSGRTTYVRPRNDLSLRKRK